MCTRAFEAFIHCWCTAGLEHINTSFKHLPCHPGARNTSSCSFLISFFTLFLCACKSFPPAPTEVRGLGLHGAASQILNASEAGS